MPGADPVGAVEDRGPVPAGHRLRLLEGVKVLDLTGYLAGPYASQILADLGADVVKVEPRTGDLTRRNPPFFFEGDSAYFLSTNRNKRSIAMDLRSPGGRKVLSRLVACSDVMLDNMRPAQRAALGLEFPQLAEVNPGIVSCSITGFGSDGPYRDRPAYDIIVEAMAGVMSLTGPEGGPSVRAGVPIGDIAAGLYAVIGVLGALLRRGATGRGTHLDIAMLDCQISLLSYLGQYYLTGGYVAGHQGRAHVSIPTYNTFPTRLGQEIVIAANSDAMWRSLCTVLGREDVRDDPRFSDLARRLRHREEIVQIVGHEFAARECGDLLRELVAAGIPAAVINSIAEALDDEQVRHRGMLVRVPHRSGGEFLTIGSPVRTSDDTGAVHRSPPALGGDTDRVLEDLGYSPAEIAELHELNAVFGTPAATGATPSGDAGSRQDGRSDD